MTTPTEINPFAPCETVQELLGQLAGAASMCWENVERAGVFESEQASALVTAAKSKLIDLIGEDESPAPFDRQLGRLLNRNNIDGDTHTPDHILADYLIACLATFKAVTAAREDWYGTKLEVKYTPEVLEP